MSSWVRRAADEQKKAEQQKNGSQTAPAAPPVPEKTDDTEKAALDKSGGDISNPAAENAPAAKNADAGTETGTKAAEPQKEPPKAAPAPERPGEKKPKAPKEKKPKRKKTGETKKRAAALAEKIKTSVANRPKKAKSERKKVKFEPRTVFILVLAALLLIGAAYTWIRAAVISEQSRSNWGENITAPDYIFYETDGQTVREALYVNNRAVLLTDTSTVFISEKGKSEEHVHNYAVPHIKANGDYVLLYDTESSRYRIENKNGIVYNSASTVGIISGAVAENGDFAIITKSSDSNYRTQIDVYSKTGEKLYNRGFVSEYAVCADLKGSGKKVAVSLIGSTQDNSTLYSKSEIISFSKDGAEVFYGPERTNENILAVYLAGSSKMIEITDKAFYETGKNRDRTVPFNSAAVRHTVYDRRSGKTAIYLSRPGNPEGDTVLVLSAGGSERARFNVKNEANALAFDGKKTVTAGSGSATVHGSSGKEKAVITCDKLISGALFAYGKVCVITPDGLAKCSLSFDRRLESEKPKAAENRGDAESRTQQEAPADETDAEPSGTEPEPVTEAPTAEATTTQTVQVSYPADSEADG
ncbi:MAG: hypothetical protein IIZ66_04055 [Clostridia bacterium]|nr:hypothetical protein [Clostridia bacterium]